MTDIVITMPCSDCGHNFSAMFAPERGRWMPLNPFDDFDTACLCQQREVDRFDIDKIDASYTRFTNVSKRLSEQVHETLADTMRISFARSVPAGQMRLETVNG